MQVFFIIRNFLINFHLSYLRINFVDALLGLAIYAPVISGM